MSKLMIWIIVILLISSISLAAVKREVYDYTGKNIRWQKNYTLMDSENISTTNILARVGNNVINFLNTINLRKNNITNASISAEDIDRDIPTNCVTDTYQTGNGDNYSVRICSGLTTSAVNGTIWNKTGNNLYPADITSKVRVTTLNVTSIGTFKYVQIGSFPNYAADRTFEAYDNGVSGAARIAIISTSGLIPAALEFVIDGDTLKRTLIRIEEEGNNDYGLGFFTTDNSVVTQKGGLTGDGDGYVTGDYSVGSVSHPERLYVEDGGGTTYIHIQNTRSNTGDSAGLKLGTFHTGDIAKSIIAHVETGAYGTGDIVFALDSSGDSGNVTLADEKMRLTSGGNLNVTGSVNLNNNTISGIYCINFSNGDTMCGNSSIDVSINGSKYFSISTDGIRIYDDNGSLLVIFNDEEKNFTARFEGSMMNNDNINDSSRFVERNLNNGSAAVAVLTARNDIPYYVSFGLTSSGFLQGLIGANEMGMGSVSPGKTNFVNRYNYPFVWYINKQNDSSLDNITEVMRLDEDGLNVSGNVTFNYADFKTKAAKYHKNGIINTPDTNWHNMTWNITVDTETTTGFELVGTDTIQSNFDGIIGFDFCLHPKNNGAGGIEMGILARLIVDDIETRCSQGFDTQTRKTGYGSDLRVSGTVNVTDGSIIRLEYKVDNSDLDFEGNSGFDRPVAATIEFSKISDLD